MFIVGCILMLVGAGVIMFGILLWKKQKATWVSMNSNVKEKDIEAFTKMSGQSTIGIGISILLMGLFWAINLMAVGFIIFGVCFIVSMAIYFIAQSKYNTNSN